MSPFYTDIPAGGRRVAPKRNDRAAELAAADRENRLIVLPCPIGTKLFMIVETRKRTYESYLTVKETKLCEANLFRVIRDFGKYVFLTKNEAQAAMELMQNE